jgi:hypothetical protein
MRIHWEHPLNAERGMRNAEGNSTGTSNCERRTLNVERFGFGASLPLTPALSLRERVKLLNIFGWSNEVDLIQSWNSRGGCL